VYFFGWQINGFFFKNRDQISEIRD
jgi:hypothetical protein